MTHRILLQIIIIISILLCSYYTLNAEEKNHKIVKLVNNNVIKSDYIVDSTRIKSKYIKYVRLAQNVISNYKDLLIEQIKRSPKKKVLLDALLSNTVGMILSEARKTYGSSVVNSMIAKNWLEVYSVQFVRDPLSKKTFFSESNINLTSDQKNVSLNIKNSIGNLKFKDKTFLLFGVTVWIRVAQTTMKK